MMASIAFHQSQEVTKALICGYSGAGKSALLATLANAGYRVHVIDLENGLDAIMQWLTPEGAKNLFYESLDVTDNETPGRVYQLIKHWKTKGEDHGLISKWGSKDVLALDNLTFYGKSCLMLERDEHGEIKDERQFFKKAGPAFERVVALLGSISTPCNVVINAHIRELEKNTESTGYLLVGMLPQALGRAFSKDIAVYFNNVWLLERKPDDSRSMWTRKHQYMKCLKSSAPNMIEAEEKAPDLSVLFDKVRSNALKIKEIFAKVQPVV